MPKDGNRKTHPASFPVSLINKILDCYARGEDSLILDPFVGSGSTLVAATSKGMRSIGLDINQEFRKAFLNRLMLFDNCSLNNGKPLWRYEICDARNRTSFFNAVQSGSVDLCITSPPYWNILNRKRSSDGKKNIAYSDSELDIGNITSYEEFLNAMGEVIQNIGEALNDRGCFILNVMDIRKGSKFYPLHQDLSAIVQKHDAFVLDDIIVWDRQMDYNSMRPLGYPYKFIINKVHEYLLVFRKYS